MTNSLLLTICIITAIPLMYAFALLRSLNKELKKVLKKKKKKEAELNYLLSMD